jgi:asparagine synthase (glutamine-hydrolysing)
MPGLFGYISHDPYDARANDALAHMVKPLQRLPFQVSATAQAGGGGLGVVALPGESLLAQREQYVLACDGEIVDLDGLRSRLRAAGDDQAAAGGQAGLLLAAALRFGVDAICGLNGLYTAALWDAGERRLTLVNDRLGIQKLYTWQSPGGFAFASEYKCISALPEFPRQVNPAGVLDLLSLGYLLDERTLFEGIQTLPHAARVTVQDGQVEIGRYWEYAFGADSGSPKSEDEYARGLGERLEAAVRRRMRPDTALLLTGGLDSRAIAGYFARHAGAETVIAATIGGEQASDVRYAREIAAALDFEFSVLPLGSDYIAEYAPVSVWKTEANMNVFAAWIFAQEAFLAARGLRHVTTGIGGEGVSGRHLWFKWLETDLDKALRLIYNKEKFAAAEALLKPSVRAVVRGASFEAVRRAVLQAPADDPLDKIDYAIHTQKMRRHATSTQVSADYARALDPYWDTEVVDYATRIPARLRAHGYLLKRLAREEFPAIANLGKPLGNSDMKPETELRLRPLLRLWQAARLRVLRQVKAARGDAGDNPSSYIQPNAALRTGSREFTLQRLGRTDLLEDLFDIDAVRALVDDQMAGRRHEHVLVCALLTFALWRQQFCE